MSYAQAVLALVKRWHNLEPDRCGPWQGEPHEWFPVAYFLARRHPRSTGRIYFTDAGAMQLGGDEELLFAVIEAIEARGWDWTIEHCTTCGHPYTAWVGPTPPGEDTGADTPAAALLGAYLAALEAQEGTNP